VKRAADKRNGVAVKRAVAIHPSRASSSGCGEQQARINRNLVIQACMRGTMRAFAQWLRVLVLCGTRWVRGLAAKQRLRSAVRELQRLDDRMLADIGVTRGEIESAVRDGLPMRMMRQSRHRDRHRDWNGIPARRQAAGFAT
jgi:uncharacterized protein YjiS (DUF1127 family)